MEQTIRLHNMVLHTKVLGPGNRAAIWLQGCKKHCKGCMAPDSRPLDGGKIVPISAIIAELSKLTDIEGVTVSGGEPFLQAEALCGLLVAIRKQFNLGVIIYSGYTLAELRALNDQWIDNILDSYADILIDGEYIDELNDGAALKGSSNQKVNFLTSRYLPYAELYKSNVRNTEVMATSKDLFFVGIPAKETLQQWTTVADHLSDEQRGAK